MRKPFLFAAVVALTTSLAPFITPRNEEAVVLKIVVIGKGVPKDPKTPAPDCAEVTKNDKEGLNVWNGAQAAWSDLKFPLPPGKLELIPMEDGGDEETVKANARKLQADPGVLVVIGHSKSGTSRWAAEIYAQAGIPLIMPVATAQAAIFPLDVKDGELPKPPQGSRFID